MRTAVALLAAAVLSLCAAPANATDLEPPRGLSTSVACMTPLATGTHGWQIGAGMRFWNAAQPYVHLTRKQVEGCGTIYAGTFNAAGGEPLGDLSGRAEFTGWDAGHSGAGGSWFYPSVTVMFNEWHRDGMRDLRNFKCWKRMVVAHEFGHALGLQHSDDPASVMNAGATGHLGRLCIESAIASDVAALDGIYALR